MSKKKSSKHRRSVLQIEIMSGDGDDHRLDEISNMIYPGLTEMGLYCHITTLEEQKEISEQEVCLIMEQNGDDPLDYNMEDAEDWRRSIKPGDQIGIERGGVQYGPFSVANVTITEDPEDGDQDSAVIVTQGRGTYRCLVREIIPGKGEVWRES